MSKFKEEKRTGGKLNVDIGILDFYKEYKDEGTRKNRKTIVDLKTYRSVLKKFHEVLSNKIVTENECYKLPYKLGLLGIIKFNQNFEINQNKWAVDWKKSKELNQVVYFENEERYKWRWDKSGMKLKGKHYYNFKACRNNNRLISKFKKENPKTDYYRTLAK